MMLQRIGLKSDIQNVEIGYKQCILHGKRWQMLFGMNLLNQDSVQSREFCCLILPISVGVLCLQNIDVPASSETFILGTLRTPKRTQLRLQNKLFGYFCTCLLIDVCISSRIQSVSCFIPHSWKRGGNGKTGRVLMVLLYLLLFKVNNFPSTIILIIFTVGNGSSQFAQGNNQQTLHKTP